MARQEQEVVRRRGRPGWGEEGLEDLALQRGRDPADPALASSSADVSAAGARAPPRARAQVLRQPQLYLGSSHIVYPIHSSFNLRNSGVCKIIF